MEEPRISKYADYVFRKDGKDWPPVTAAEATSVVIRTSCYTVELSWPSKSVEAITISKMIRDAFNAGESAKAEQICDVLGLSIEAKL